MNKLDEALNASEPDGRKAKQHDAKAIIEEDKLLADGEPLLAALASSAVASSNIKNEILAVLNDFPSKL